MAPTPAYPLQIYFDGACPVCTNGMEFYRHKDHGGRLEFIDISAPDFAPAPPGLTMEALRHALHAMDSNGRIYRGVDAFRAIWQAFPASARHRLLATLVALPGVHLAARSVYWCFARMRRYLPKSSAPCRDGSCGTGRKPDP